MKRYRASSVLGAALLSATVAVAAEGGEDVVRWKEITAGASRIRFYGFLRLDAVSDDSRPNNFQSIGWILSEDPSVGEPNVAEFETWSLGIDFKVPILSWLGVAGEAWKGANLSDFRGTSGQAINLTTGQEIHGEGAWLEVSFKAGKAWSLHKGVTTDDPDDVYLQYNF